MRDRLIELLDELGVIVNVPDKVDEDGCGTYTIEGGEYVADYLLAKGVIVPPCKVGDTVYVVSQGAGFSVVWNVYKSTAKAIHLDRWGQLFIHVETDKENIGGYVEIERVFLTREEAERALKGGEMEA